MSGMNFDQGERFTVGNCGVPNQLVRFSSIVRVVARYAGLGDTALGTSWGLNFLFYTA